MVELTINPLEEVIDMIFKRKKNSGAAETESQENRSNSLEQTLELTLTEVKELRAEMTMLRKELLGDKFMELTGNDEFADGQVDILPGDVKVPVVKDVMLNPQYQDVDTTVEVQQADMRSESLDEPDSHSEPQTVKVEGWATVDFRQDKNRRWWQFWKSKKSKYKENDLDFA